MQKNKNFRPKKELIPYNNYIRANKVRCIDSNGDNLGVIDTREAIKIAVAKELDLVQISSPKDEIPVCKITDYGKYKFELIKKKKEAAKKQRESIIKIKEIKFRPCTDNNDLKIKANKAKEFLDEGNQIKISIIFRGREISHQDVALETLRNFVDMISNIKFIGQPSIQGKSLTVLAGRSNDNN